MALQHRFTVQSAMIVVLWTGIGGFVVLHTMLLLSAGNEQTRTLFRLMWVGGLVVVFITSLYWMSNGQEITET